MNFLRQAAEDPEINLIPLVDVLLVILIFLMVTTTYSRYAELRINLPTAAADRVPDRPRDITLAITATGRYVLEGRAIDASSSEVLAAELRRVRAERGGVERAAPVVVIEGVRVAGLQAVVTAMEAARMAGLAQVTISTQSTSTPSASSVPLPSASPRPPSPRSAAGK